MIILHLQMHSAFFKPDLSFESKRPSLMESPAPLEIVSIIAYWSM